MRRRRASASRSWSRGSSAGSAPSGAASRARRCCGRATCSPPRAACPGAAEAITGSLDAAAAFAQRDYMTSSWSDETQTPWLDSKGIELVRGHGRLAGERTVEVETDAGVRHAHRRRARSCSRPARRPSCRRSRASADARAWDNRDATSTSEVPRRFLVLGGGPIGVELAQAFRRLGSEQVTVIEGGRAAARARGAVRRRGGRGGVRSRGHRRAHRRQGDGACARRRRGARSL